MKCFLFLWTLVLTLCCIFSSFSPSSPPATAPSLESIPSSTSSSWLKGKHGKRHYILSPTLGAPDILHRAPSLKLAPKAYKLAIEVNLSVFAPSTSLKTLLEIEETLLFYLVRDSEKTRYPLRLTGDIPAQLAPQKHFRGYYGLSSQTPLPQGVYHLELYQKSLVGTNPLLEVQRNAVFLDDLSPQDHPYSFIVLQGLEKTRKGETQLKNFFQFLQNPERFLAKTNFLSSNSQISRKILVPRQDEEILKSNLLETARRIREAKFIICLGEMLASPSTSETTSSFLSPGQKLGYEENYEELYSLMASSPKPIFFVPGSREGALISGEPDFDGLRYFESHFGPLTYNRFYRGRQFVFLNTYDLALEDRRVSKQGEVVTGGSIPEDWSRGLPQLFNPQPTFLFAAHDPRGGGSLAHLPFTSYNSGNLQKWEGGSEKGKASWMRPKSSEDSQKGRWSLLKFLAEGSVRQAFWGNSLSYWQEYFVPGNNLIQWKAPEDWKRNRLFHSKNFLKGIFLIEAYYFLPVVLMQQRLAELDSQYPVMPIGLRESLKEYRLGLPQYLYLFGEEGKQELKSFVQALEYRVERMTASQLRLLLDSPQKRVSFFEVKPEFATLYKKLQEMKYRLNEEKDINDLLDMQLAQWQQSNYRFFLDAEEYRNYLALKEMTLNRDTTLTLTHVPPFHQKSSDLSPFLLVTVPHYLDGDTEVQVLKMDFQGSLFIYLLWGFLVGLELFYFQWTRSLWMGLLEGFAETWDEWASDFKTFSFKT
jgi:hypothetical protein